MSNLVDIYTGYNFLNVTVKPPSLEMFRKYWIVIPSSPMTLYVSNFAILA